MNKLFPGLLILLAPVILGGVCQVAACSSVPAWLPAKQEETSRAIRALGDADGPPCSQTVLLGVDLSRCVWREAGVDQHDAVAFTCTGARQLP